MGGQPMHDAPPLHNTLAALSVFPSWTSYHWELSLHLGREQMRKTVCLEATSSGKYDEDAPF